MHSSRMHTICSSSHLSWGVCLSACWDTNPPGPVTPWSRPHLGPGTPWDQAPPRSRTLPEQTPQTRHPPGTRLGQTHTCKNITFTTSLWMVKTGMSEKQLWKIQGMSKMLKIHAACCMLCAE